MFCDYHLCLGFPAVSTSLIAPVYMQRCRPLIAAHHVLASFPSSCKLGPNSTLHGINDYNNDLILGGETQLSGTILVSPCGKLQHSWLHSWSDEALCMCISRLMSVSQTPSLCYLLEITDPNTKT